MTPQREIEIANKVNFLLEKELTKEETPQLVALIPIPGKHYQTGQDLTIRGVEETFNRLARIVKQVASELELNTNEVFRALGATLNKKKNDPEEQKGTNKVEDPAEDIPNLDMEGLDPKATNTTIINTHINLLKRNIEKYLNEGRSIEIIEVKKHEVETVRILVHYEIQSTFAEDYLATPIVVQISSTDDSHRALKFIISNLESRNLKRKIFPGDVKIKSETRLPNDPTWVVHWYSLSGTPGVQKSFISEETLEM